jgi:hypothetical protein
MRPAALGRDVRAAFVQVALEVALRFDIVVERVGDLPEVVQDPVVRGGVVSALELDERRVRVAIAVVVDPAVEVASTDLDVARRSAALCVRRRVLERGDERERGHEKNDRTCSLFHW